MATHSRHHRRSIFSSIRRWFGSGHRSVTRSHSEHRRQGKWVYIPEPETPPENTTDTPLPVKDEPTHGHSHHRSHHRKSRSKQSWFQKVKLRITALFTGKSGKVRKKPSATLFSRIRKQLGLSGTGRKQKPELFYRVNDEGSYQLIKSRPVTSTGINEDGMPELRHVSQRKHFHRQRPLQSWKRRLRHIYRKIRRAISWNKKSSRVRRHSVNTRNTTAGAGELRHRTVHTASGAVTKPHGFTFRELFNSWLNLSYLVKLLSSMGLFTTAYVITWLTYSLAVMVAASFSEIYAVLYYFEVMWPEGSSSPLWNPNNAIAITFAGPFISLVMALVYYTLLRKVANMETQIKTLVFWLFLLSSAHFLGAFAGGAITWQGLGYVLVWLHIPTVVKFIISILSLMAMVWIGWKYARFILEIRPVKKHGNNIPLLLINRMVLPAILGILLLIFIKLPNTTPQHPHIWDYDVIILTSVLFAVIPPVFNLRLRPLRNVQKTLSSRNRSARAIFAICLSVVVLLLYRFGLSTGLYIYMKFAVHISTY